MAEVNLVKYPIVQDLITKLRDIKTDSERYRIYTKQVTTFLVYESLKDITMNKKNVHTQTGVVFNGETFSEKIAFITILRAGLGMFIPVLDLFPEAEFHAVGMKRNEDDPFHTEPYFYLDRLTEMSQNVSRIVIVDPMFATGGSMLALLKALREKHQYKGKVNIVSLIVAKEGAKKVLEKYPDVSITCAGYDKDLNDKGYIVPGLGDAGDRFFGIATDLDTVR